MIIFMDNNFDRVQLFVEFLPHSERVMPLLPGEAKKVIENTPLNLEDKLIVCIHSDWDCYKFDHRGGVIGYQDRDSVIDLVDKIREIRPETRIIIYSGLEYPVDEIIENIKPDNYIGHIGNNEFFREFTEALVKKGDVSVWEMRERGITVEMLSTGKRVGKQLIRREREGD
jgi:hypothetical protein